MPQISTQLVPVTFVSKSTGTSAGSQTLMRPRLVKIGSRYVFPYAGTTGTIITNFGAMTDSDIANLTKGSIVANTSAFSSYGHIISTGTSTASSSTSSKPYNFGISTVNNRTYFGNSTAYHSVLKNPTKYCNVSFVYNNVKTTIGSFSGYLPGGYLIDTSRPMVSFEIHVFINQTNSYSSTAPDVYIGRINSSGKGSNKKLDKVNSDSSFRHYYWRSSGSSRFVSLPIVIRPNADNYRARVHWCYVFTSSVT